MSWENLIKDQGFFCNLGDHYINSHNLSVDSVWVLLGEYWSWSLLGLKGLNQCLDCPQKSGGCGEVGVTGGSTVCASLYWARNKNK